MKRSRIAILAGLLIVLATLTFGMSQKKATDSATATARSNSGPIWISRTDGGKKCAGDVAETLAQGATELNSAGVQILSSRKGNDGKQHAQMCGLPSGTENVYQIPSADFPKAVVLGFKEAPIAP